MAERFVSDNANEEAMKAGHWVEGQADPDVNNQHVQHVLVDGNIIQLIRAAAAEQQIGEQNESSDQQVVLQEGGSLQDFSGEVVTEEGHKVTKIIVDGNMQFQVEFMQEPESEAGQTQMQTDQNDNSGANYQMGVHEKEAVVAVMNLSQDKEDKVTVEKLNKQLDLKQAEGRQSKSLPEKMRTEVRKSTDGGYDASRNIQVTAHIQEIRGDCEEGQLKIASVESTKYIEDVPKQEENVEPKMPEPEPGMVLSLCAVTGKYINVPASSQEEKEADIPPPKSEAVKPCLVDIGRTRDLVAQALAARQSIADEAFEKPLKSKPEVSINPVAFTAPNNQVIVREGNEKTTKSPSAEPDEKSQIVFLSESKENALVLDDSQSGSNEDVSRTTDKEASDEELRKSVSDDNDSEMNELSVIDGISAFYTPVIKTSKMIRQVSHKSRYGSDVQLKSLMSTLQAQRIKGKNCDLIFPINNDQYWAHSCIVTACTDYFSSMMTPRAKGTSTYPLTQVNLNGIMKTATLKTLLDFIYTGSVDLNYDSAIAILELASDLGDGCKELMEFCSQHLEHCVNKSNFASVIALAVKHSLTDLYKYCIGYVSEYLDIIVQTEELMGLTYETVKEIVNIPNEKKSHAAEHTKLQFICNWVVFDTSDRMDNYDELCSYVNYSLVEKPVFEMLMKSELCSHANLWEHPVTLAIVDKNEFASRSRGRPRKSLPVSLKVRISMEKEAAENSPEKDLSVPVKKRKYNPKDFDEFEAGELMLKDEIGEVSLEDETEMANVSDEDYVVGADIITPRKRGRPKGSTKKQSRNQTLTATVTRRGRLVKPRVFEGEESPVASDTPSKYSPAKGRRIFFCPRDGCSFLARDRQRLIDHISMKHDGIKRHACSVCNKLFSSVRHLQRHKKLHLDDKPIMCGFCDYNTTRNDLLKNHIRHQHPKDAVDIGIMTETELDDIKVKLQTPGRRGRKPNITVSPETPMECSQCDKEFTNMISMKAHLKGHGVEEPLLCETCGFSTKHYASMRLHRLNHSGLDPPYKCHIEGCTYASFRKSRLTDHVNKHLNIRNFICSVCGKGFTTRKHMTRHELTHSEQKPFMCQECDYGTARSDKLKEHTRSRHPERAIQLGLMTKEEIRTPKLPRKTRTPKKTITPVTMVPQQSNIPKNTPAIPQDVNTVPHTAANLTNLQPAQTHTLVYTGNQPGTVQVETYTPYSTVSEEVMAYFAHYQDYDGSGQQQATIHIQPQSSQNQQ